MKKIIYFSGIILLLFAVTSCEDFLEESPEDRYVIDNFYSSGTDAKAAVDAVYSTLYQRNYRRFIHLLADLPTDDFKNGIGMSNSQLQDLEYMRHTSENSFVTNIWRDSYDGINRANTAIDRIPTVTMEEGLKTRLIAEARFLRSLFYFNLVRLFGDVPVMLKIESLDDVNVERSPVSQVYAQIIQDLEFAESNLPKTYNGSDVGRATEGAAKALLGKVYLTKGEWQSASNKLAEIINAETNYGYGLHEDFGANWDIATENGMEMIFSIQFMETPGVGNQEMNGISPKYSLPEGKYPGFSGNWESDIPTIDLFNIFTDDDERKSVTFNFDYVIQTKDGPDTLVTSIPMFYKYFEKGETNAGRCDVNFHVLRYADVLLMYAEALIEQNQVTQAIPHINRIIERAFNNSDNNLSTGLSQSEAKDALRLERRKELAHEGQRYFDLQRWGNFVDVMKAHGVAEASLAESNKTDIVNNVSAKHVLMPIPQREIDLNPLLEQNTGY